MAHQPITPFYVPENAAGMLAFRPAATVRRAGMAEAMRIIADEVGLDEFAEKFHVDLSKPGAHKLGFEDVEWVTCGIGIGRARARDSNNRELHSLSFSGLTIRTIAPFDFLGLLRQWNLECTEVREGGRSYYRLTGPMQPIFGPHPCACLLDDRTIVFDEEERILPLIRRQVPMPPSYLRGQDWERASHGLLAAAIDNEDGKFAKLYDLGRPDDALVLELLKGVQHWTFGVADSDSLSTHLSARLLGSEPSQTLARTIESFVKMTRDQLEQVDSGATMPELERLCLRMAKEFLAKLKIQQTENSVELRTDGFGSLADLAAIVLADAKGSKAALEDKKSKKR